MQDGICPVHLASHYGHTEVVYLLPPERVWLRETIRSRRLHRRDAFVPGELKSRRPRCSPPTPTFLPSKQLNRLQRKSWHTSLANSSYRTPPLSRDQLHPLPTPRASRPPSSITLPYYQLYRIFRENPGKLQFLPYTGKTAKTPGFWRKWYKLRFVFPTTAFRPRGSLRERGVRGNLSLTRLHAGCGVYVYIMIMLVTLFPLHYTVA